jgi:DNA-directed RNA polymerase specialized sigma24 family protein
MTETALRPAKQDAQDREMRRALRVARQQDASRGALPPKRLDSGAAGRVQQLALAIAAASAARDLEETIEAAVEAPRPRMPRGPQVDFDIVPPQQYAIDARLRNWGTWCNGTAAASSSPMFRLSQSSARAREGVASSGNGVDRTDAVKIARAVTSLPPRHAGALNWCYVKPVSPRKACETFGTTMGGLATLLDDGRQMLINRGF